MTQPESTLTRLQLHLIYRAIVANRRNQNSTNHPAENRDSSLLIWWALCSTLKPAAPTELARSNFVIERGRACISGLSHHTQRSRSRPFHLARYRSASNFHRVDLHYYHGRRSANCGCVASVALHRTAAERNVPTITVCCRPLRLSQIVIPACSTLVACH
nr:hypothetical protein CFP56_69890 [Quercus suber]